MKSFLRIFVFFVFAVVFVPHSFAVDTLEVFALRVQFQEEKTDNSLTTGTGIFDSDKKEKDAYLLDPPGRRGSSAYWQKHFEFANAFYGAASGGKQVIKARIFPDPSTNTSVYTVKKQIIDYNRTSKMKGEKTAEFDEARSRDYLTFVYDAIAAASEDTSKVSPFRIPLSKNPNVKRAYMIIHAGASRLVDGGSMGTDGADTPGDFMDVYISDDAWEYLMPDSAKEESVVPTFGVNDEGDTVVNGVSIAGSVIDTLKSVMVVSETASQDGLNWGVNGIVVNQIGRELGMPNTYDVVKGISRLGYFDVMDFAGYNAGNGFLPSMPGAWERSYMGWSNVKEVRPTAGHPVTVDIAAAGSGIAKNGEVEIVKVPLNASEYLLIENRQRSWNKDGTVDVVVGTTSDDTDTTIKTVPVDSLEQVFLDSICVKGKCRVNKKKAKGLIVGVSSYDAGIPASGIAVWKVNEWYLRETLKMGVANFWGGDTLRDHQFGISLVEADGILSIGKTFKNALGQDSYDYGSGTDLLPHKREPLKEDKNKKKFDLVNTISPRGYANTATTQGGYTGYKITVNVPKKSREEKTSNAFMGDSVVNYAAPVISVTVSIDDGSIENSKFPRNVGLANATRGAVFLDSPEDDSKIIAFASEDGTLQAMSALGDTLFEADTVVTVPAVSKKDSVSEVPLYRMDESRESSYGPFIGMASQGEAVYMLYRDALVRTTFVPGTYLPLKAVVSFNRTNRAVAGPVIVGGDVWVAGEKSIMNCGSVANDEDLNSGAFNGRPSAYRLPQQLIDNDDHVQEFVYCPNSENMTKFAAVTEQGNVFFASDYSSSFMKMRYADKSYRIACTDINRDGVNDVILVGDKGSVTTTVSGYCTSEKEAAFFSQQYKRGASGTSGLKSETSGIAIGDVNGDNYPEVVFLGDNLVYALDRFGVPIAGFPATISRGTPVVGFFSDPLIVDVTGDDVPEILVPSSDGLIYAFTGKGKQVTDGFPLAAGSFEYGETYAPMSIYVTDAVSGKNSAGPELYAFHRNSVSAFRLNKAVNGAELKPAAWTLPAAGNGRTGFFDATLLGKIKEITAKDEINDFFIYPNPVRGGKANLRFELGAEAKSVELEFYDVTGLVVASLNVHGAKAGRNQYENFDLSSLGSDVYTARLKVKFADGKTKKKLYRVGVIR